MTARIGRRILMALIILAAVFAVWNALLGPRSGYWGVVPMAGDPPPLSAQQRPTGALRVLFIGNSFTAFWGGQSVIGMRLAGSSPLDSHRRAIYEQSTGNGYDLRNHWEFGRALDRIREGNWDFVVLQDHSEGPLAHPDRFIKYVNQFDIEIRKSGARTVLFSTWAKLQRPQDQATLDRAYESLGSHLHAGVVPVGDAFARARRMRPDLQLYEPDGKHPSAMGSYLTACCFYSFFYQCSAIGLERTLEGPGNVQSTLSERDAADLQRIAFETVHPLLLEQWQGVVGPQVMRLLQTAWGLLNR